MAPSKGRGAGRSARGGRGGPGRGSKHTRSNQREAPRDIEVNVGASEGGEDRGTDSAGSRITGLELVDSVVTRTAAMVSTFRRSCLV